MTAIAERPATALLVGTPDQTAPAATPGDVRVPGRHRVAAAHRSPSMARKILGKVAGIIGSLLFVLTALILLGMTVGPRVFHYQTATMLTGSMVPTIRPGDVIVDVKEKAADMKVGQIITYHIPVDDHRVESHRVTWVKHQKNGAVLFRTKGDANNGEDPWTARATGSNVWRVTTVLPVAGSVIRFMRQPMVQMVLTRGLPVLLVGSVLLSIWRKPAEADDAAEETPTREQVEVAFVALLALLLVCIPAVANAKFTNKVAQTRAQQVSTDTLSAPTGVTVKCYGSAGRITVSWTPTTDAYATGYNVTGYFGGSRQTVVVTPRTATSVSPTSNVPMGTSVTMTSEYLRTVGSKTTDWISASTAPVTVATNCPEPGH